jgi:hypothetical protein
MMHGDVFIRWYMVTFFVLLGVTLLAYRRCFASVQAYFLMQRQCGAIGKRVAAAVRRREKREALPASAMGLIVGGTSVAFGAAGAFTRVSVTLLYELLALVLGLTLFAGYMRLRRAGGRRTASLRRRDPETILPPYAYAFVAVAVVMPLTWLPAAPAGALLTTLAGLVIALTGWGVAAMPAMLTGDDTAVEQYVDDRVRSGRTVNLLGTAVAPGFFFMALTHYTDSWLHVAALLVSLAALLVSVALQFGLLRRGPSAADLERWAQTGA